MVLSLGRIARWSTDGNHRWLCSEPIAELKSVEFSGGTSIDTEIMISFDFFFRISLVRCTFWERDCFFCTPSLSHVAHTVLEGAYTRVGARAAQAAARQERGDEQLGRVALVFMRVHKLHNMWGVCIAGNIDKPFCCT